MMNSGRLTVRLWLECGDIRFVSPSAFSKRARAFDFWGAVHPRTTPVPPVIAASSASFPLPLATVSRPPIPSRFL